HQVLPHFRNQIGRKLRKSVTDRGNGSSLDHSKKTPPEQESNELAIGFLKVNVLATSLDIHSAEHSIAYRSRYGHEAGNNPNADQPTHTAYIPKDIGADNKNTGTDHRTRHKHGSIP